MEKIIETKFDIGEKVFFMQQNKIDSGTIYGIKIHIDTTWEMQTHNMREDTFLKYQYCYDICTEPMYSRGIKDMSETSLFKNKEDLIQSLLK